MQTRLSKMNWLVLGVSLVLISGSPTPSSGEWWKFRSKCKTDDNCDECQGSSHRCRLCHGRGWNTCHGCHGRGCHLCHGRGYFSCRCYNPINASYCDYRDRLVYSAEGYNVPVTVPLAPNCRIYNYGWGIPSSRFSSAAGYAAWLPDKTYSQNGGSLPGNLFQTIYQPTDTTQTGIYYNYVPTWQWR
jgi:hypothetical protein